MLPKLSIRPPWRVTMDGRPAVALSDREAALLRRLQARPLVSRSEMIAELWPNPDDEPAAAEDAVHQALHRLRRKLAPFGVGIETERGRGYRLVVDPSSAAGNPFGAPDAVYRTLVRAEAPALPLLASVRALGPGRVRWAGNPPTGTDLTSWELDGRRATRDELVQTARGARDA